MRRAGGIAAFLAAVLTAAAAGSLADTKVIAVRTDARPFAWQSQDDSETYRGYLVDLCLDATTRAGYHFDIVPVGPKEREHILQGKFEVEGAEGSPAVKKVDLLCDPTTITLGRIEALVGAGQYHATFGPIVFVANGSYVRHAARDDQAVCEITPKPKAGEPPELQEAPHPACRKDEVHWVPTRAESRRSGKVSPRYWVLAPESARCLPEGGGMTAYFMAAGLDQTTAPEALERAARLGRLGLRPGQKICWEPQDNHRDGVQAFCNRRFQYYFGDLDIINAYRRQIEEEGAACAVAAGPALSYEPYALLITSEDAKYRARLIAAIYELFADGTASSRFDSYFPGYGKSTALELLYRINKIPVLRPDYDEHGAPGEEEETEVSSAAAK